MSASTPELPSSIDVDLEPGTVVGEYEVETRLGHGAFGTVYKALHPLIGKVVAIKVLARKYSVDPDMVRRFVDEARAVNQIRNRHIIDIFSFGALADGRQYYVMEYLDGEPLDALIDRVGNLSIADALPILRAIAKALDAAHAKGIAHRDLKAENIFLGKDSDGALFPKLLDFGIAKLLGPEQVQANRTGTGVPIGTPFYMSPEQCRGKDVDHRTDYYAFGVLLYRMLTGVYPFDGDDHMSILMKQLNEDPVPPSSHLPDLPSTIDDVVLWLLAKEPAGRPPDLKTAVRALEQLATEAGLDIGTPASGWDAQSSPSISPLQTLPPRRTRASTPAAVPATTAGLAQTQLPAPPRSRVPVVGGIVVLAALAVIGFVLLGRGGREDAAAPPVAPTPAPPSSPVATPVLPPAPEPTPAVPAVAPAPTPAQPERTTVIIDVTGVPDGTEVVLAGDVVGVAPGPVQLKRGSEPQVLTFRRGGYIPVSRTVTPSADGALAVTLRKKSGGGSKSTKDDIINVDFGK